MFRFRFSLVLMGVLLFAAAVFPVKADEIRFLHHFEDMKQEIALGDPNPVANTAKIVDDGWNFYGVSPGSGLEVVNGTRLDFNAEGNIDWNVGSLEFWIMPYVDLKDATNHKFFCTPMGHDDPNAFNIWKTGAFDDLRFRLRDDVNAMTEAVWPGASGWKAKEWHHIAVSWDNEVGLRLYADSELVASSNASWENDPGYATFSVGGQGGSVTTNGVIDELVIYDYVIEEEYVKERFEAIRPLKDPAAIEAESKLVTTWGRLRDR